MYQSQGSNPSALYWMGMIFFTLICCKRCNNVCLKRPKIKTKRGRSWPILKSIFLLLEKPSTYCVIDITSERAGTKHRIFY